MPLRHRHALLYMTSTASIAAAYALRPEDLTPSVQIIILCVMVAVAGLPHGAMDPTIARAAGIIATRREHAGFFLAYTALAGAVVLSWWIIPGPVLVAFLAISAFHFGGDWADRLAPWDRLMAGALVLGMPAIAHQDEVARIFAVLAPASTSAAVATGLAGVGVLTGAGLVLRAMAFWPRTTESLRIVTELVTVIAAAVVLPPLIAFVTYFCFLHSPRHLIDSARAHGLTRPRDLVLATVPLTVVSLLVAYGAYVTVTSPAMETHAALKIVFIGLAALTVPHMLLVEAARKARGKLR